MNGKFNKYCAYIMRYEIRERPSDIGIDALWCERKSKDNTDYEQFFSRLGFYYNPYNDLNQMADVFDKLNSKGFDKHMQVFNLNIFVKALPIKQAVRDFIISTMPDSNEGHHKK